MVSTVLILSIFFIQFIQLSAFYNKFRIEVQRVSPINANPLFFGGRKLPVKDSDKPTKEINNKVTDDREESNDINQIVKTHDEERLQKVIARAGLASRRGAEEMVVFYIDLLLYYQ
jgi:hypothetical protein